MNLLKKLFPFSFKATQLSSLLAAVIVCVLVDVVCGWVIGLVAKLPLVGWIFSILGAVIGLYALVGIVVALLVFFKVLK
ncbi:MAG: hypothetical protein J6J83_06925 [Oscillospiraceae bacterium]|nr:hypothetical protein [Oscillospiraceae bacterium]